MNKFRKSLLIGVTVLSLGAASFAAQAVNESDERGSTSQNCRGEHQRHGENRIEHRAQRQAKLHDMLKLSAEQEPAWKDFTASMTPSRMGKRPDRAGLEKLSAPARMEQRLAMMKKVEANMQTRLAAMKTFYAALTPEQQKVLDDNMGKGRPHQGHHKR